MKCKQKRNRRYLKHRKLWRKINLLSWYIEVQNLLTSIIMILEVSNKHDCKIDKILKKIVSNIICDFQSFLSNTKAFVAFQYYFTNKGSFLFWHYCYYLDILNKLLVLQRKQSKNMYAKYLNFPCFIRKNWQHACMHFPCFIWTSQ